MNLINFKMAEEGVNKRFKVYTSSAKASLQNAYHLATFNQLLERPEELPQYIKEEQVTSIVSRNLKPDEENNIPSQF